MGKGRTNMRAMRAEQFNRFGLKAGFEAAGIQAADAEAVDATIQITDRSQVTLFKLQVVTIPRDASEVSRLRCSH